jgi:hypothetical protein
MNNFKDFGIKPKVNSFVGDKIAVKKILNTQVKVLDFKIVPSTAKPGTECLTIQIERPSGEKRVIFTGSTGLREQIRQVPKEKLPFTTTIVEENECYEFT